MISCSPSYGRCHYTVEPDFRIQLLERLQYVRFDRLVNIPKVESQGIDVRGTIVKVSVQDRRGEMAVEVDAFDVGRV